MSKDARIVLMAVALSVFGGLQIGDYLHDEQGVGGFALGLAAILLSVVLAFLAIYKIEE